MVEVNWAIPRLPHYSIASDNLCLFPLISVSASPRFYHSPGFQYGNLDKFNIDNRSLMPI